MITGFLEPTDGTITVNGKEIGGDRRTIQQNIGYLPENCPVYPDMTAVEYPDYMASLHWLRRGKNEPPWLQPQLSGRG